MSQNCLDFFESVTAVPAISFLSMYQILYLMHLCYGVHDKHLADLQGFRSWFWAWDHGYHTIGMQLFLDWLFVHWRCVIFWLKMSKIEQMTWIHTFYQHPDRCALIYSELGYWSGTDLDDASPQRVWKWGDLHCENTDVDNCFSSDMKSIMEVTHNLASGSIRGSYWNLTKVSRQGPSWKT